MKKYTKRSICFILVLILFLSTVPPVNASSEKTHYLSIGLNAFFDTDGHNDLLNRSNSAHLYFVKDMRETKMGTLAIKVLSFIYDMGVDESGTEPDEAKCAEVLVNIMKTYEMENAAEISKQHKMDNLKAVEDYALDIVDISAGYVQLLIGSSDDRLVTGIDKAISVLSATKDSTEDLIDILSDFETVTQSYVQFDSLLALVEENGHGSLKSAASALRNSMTQAMYCRLDMYADASQSVAGEFTECFFQDVFFDALKETDTYASNEAFGWFVDLGTNAINIYTPLHLGADIGKFVGNIAVGAEDIVNRTLEMKAIYDITQILEDELWFIYHTFTSNFTEETDAAAERYVVLGNYLISCRIRGEYCLYSMLAKDSGLASRLDDETAIAAEKQYNHLTARMADLKETLDGIPNVLVVDIGSEMPYEAVNTTSEWNVYGADGKLYDNYTLRIYDKQSLLNFVHTGPVDEPDPTVTEYVVDSAEPLPVMLEAGYAYTFEFIDNDNLDKIELMTVGVISTDQDLISVVDVDTEFGQVSQRLLTQINRYNQNGKLENETIFQYNESGILTSIVDREISTTGNVLHEATIPFTFDSEGRLLEIGDANSDYYSYDTAGYTYNTSGQLTSSYLFSGGGSSCKYEYDSLGKLTKCIENMGDGLDTVETDFIYDSTGVLIEAIETSTYMWGEEPSIEVITYTYSCDEQGRITEISSSTETTHYCNDYRLFTIEEYTSLTSSYSYTTAHLADIMGHTIWSIPFASAEITADKEGYMLSAKADMHSEVVSYEFYYDGEQPATSTEETEDVPVVNEHNYNVSGPLTYPISEEACYIIYKNWNGSELDESEYAAVTKRYSPDSEYAHFMLEFYWSDFTASGVPEWYFEIDLNTGECMAGPTGSPPRTFNAEDYYY